MEEYSELEHATGSPTAGESGFVHVESIDSASMDGSAINQDDGVVVTRVDTVQDESNDSTMADDGGNEEFVDCPDDLLSEVVSEGQQTFDTEDNQLREILPHHYQEERQQLMTELTNLRHQLKVLIKKQPLIDGKDSELFTYEHAKETVVGDDKSLWPLHEMIFDCSRFIELALSEQTQTEHTIKELHTTLDTKDKEINELNVKVIEHSLFETTTDRILTSLSNALGVEKFPDTSVSGKMLHLEKGTSFLIQNYTHFLSEVEMLKRKEIEWAHKCSHLEDEYRKLMGHFKKGQETIKMLNLEIGRVKGEVEVEKTKYGNTREKLNMAVTKGKSLVQQRDSLKQEVAEKTSELDKCLVELKEKSKIETLANSLKDESFKLKDEIKRMKEAACEKIDCLTVSLLMEAQEKNFLEDEFAELTNKNRSMKIDLKRSEDKVASLKEKLSMAVKKGKGLVQERDSMKQQIAEKTVHIETLKLDLKQKEATMDDFKDQIKKLESDLVQERDNMKQQIAEKNVHIETLKLDLKQKEATMDDFKDQIKKLESDLVQERDNMKQQIAEKNVHIETLKLDLKQKEATMDDFKDQIKKLESDLVQERDNMKQQVAEKNVHIETLKLELRQKEATMNGFEEQIKKMESDLIHLKEERDQIEKFLIESNTMLQKVIDATNEIVVPVDVTDPVEKVKWCASYLSECRVFKAKLEDDLRDVKQEMEDLKDKLQNVLKEKIEAEKEVEVLKEELQNAMKKKIEAENEVEVFKEELQNAMKEKIEVEQEMGVIKEEVIILSNKLKEIKTNMKSLEDVLLDSEKKMTQIIEEKQELEVAKCNVEEKLQKAMEEVTFQNSKIEEIIASKKSLEEMLSKDEVSTHENEKNRNLLESEIKKLKDESVYNEHKFMEASETIKTLEDEMLKVNNTVLNLDKEKKNSEQEFSNFLDNLEVLLKDGTLLTLVKQSMEKKVDIFIEMDQHLNDINSHFDSEHLQDYPSIEEKIQLPNLESVNGEDSDNNGLQARKTLEKLKLRNQILTNEFIRFSKFIDEITTSCLIKMEAIKKTIPNTLEKTKTLQKIIHDSEMDKQEQENKISVMSNEIKELRDELEKTRSMYEKFKEENDTLKNKVLKMETELEASQNMCDKMGINLQDYRVKEDEWNKRETELTKQLTSFIRNHEAENERGLSEASEISEVEDPVSIGKRNMPLVRTVRKGSNDHLALNIEPESDRLLEHETVQDKGHVFKSLHTSGFVPPQGKMIADRLDGIWVSGSGALMSRPRVRLGFIAYWVMLHLWLVGTLL